MVYANANCQAAFLESILVECRATAAAKLQGIEPGEFLNDTVYQQSVTAVQEIPGLAKGKVDFLLEGGLACELVRDKSLHDVQRLAMGNRLKALEAAVAAGDAAARGLALEACKAQALVAVSVNERNADGDTALLARSAGGDATAARLLLLAGADSGAMREGTDLNAGHFAAQGGHAGVVAVLRAHGCDLEAVARSEVKAGRTALQYASERGGVWWWW